MSPTETFLTVANSHPEFSEALEIIAKNSDGRAWLIGGCVCRSIIEGLYGIPLPRETDFDVIVETLLPLALPIGWTSKANSYGNPKLIGPAYSIDMIPLGNIHSIVRRNLEPTIENFLSGTPLNIQSIAFDIESQIVIGDIGLRAIQEKIIAVNDLEQAKYRANKKGVSVEALITDIANQFNFTPIYPKVQRKNLFKN